MVGITHGAMRTLIGEFGGCDYYYSEMISAPWFVSGGRYEASYASGAPEPERMIYQLTGKEPESLAAAARILAQQPCAGIDVNMGCAAPHIHNSGQGTAWMKDPEGARAAVAAVREAAGAKPVSVKVRLGDVPDEAQIVAFCRGLVEAGASRIVLHPRARRQKYSRPADWRYIGVLKRELDVPVVGNGDIDSPEALERRRDSGADGYMIGRAAIAKPWLFARIRGTAPASADLLATGLRLLELLPVHQPEDFHISRARRFFFYFCDNLKFGHQLKFAIQKAESLGEIKGLWSGYFERNPGERLAAT